eukprot:m.478044 g.478044  ORF g.478044 m.478044 type:complete len:202 (-) comp21017_c0_seq1:89-694(-)
MEGGRDCRPFTEQLEWSWQNVTAAFWRRYPNPFSAHVLTEDVLSRTVDPVTKCLTTKRLITKTNSRPKWMDRFLGENPVCLVLEESVVDLNNRKMTVSTRNLNMKHLMEVEQHTEFTACNTTGNTIAEIHSQLKSELRHIGGIVEKFGVERLKYNTAKAFKGLRYALEEPVALKSPATRRKLFNAPRFAQKAYCNDAEESQ